ncbi:MAG: nucleoside phosphorylase [Chloroflexota bacterium]|nr:nucleoside phosphorylase [Lentimicrobium sp.]
MAFIGHSELLLNKDGSIYHLNLFPDEIAKNILLVGDPGRVPMVSAYFDSIEVKKQNREIISHTGFYKGLPVTVMSTGMGTDNIDIVLNEIDALFNIDLVKREAKTTHTSLNIVRIGTSGALQGGIPPDSTVVSSYGLGLDGMLYYYRNLDMVMDHNLTEAFITKAKWPSVLPTPYIVEGSSRLLTMLGDGFIKGITATAPGFYGPQGRKLRLNTYMEDLNERLAAFEYHGKTICNFEMETSALYGLSKMMGHHALTLTNIVANRVDKTHTLNYKESMEKLIITVLDRLSNVKK